MRKIEGLREEWGCDAEGRPILVQQRAFHWTIDGAVGEAGVVIHCELPEVDDPVLDGYPLWSQRAARPVHRWVRQLRSEMQNRRPPPPTVSR